MPFHIIMRPMMRGDKNKKSPPLWNEQKTKTPQTSSVFCRVWTPARQRHAALFGMLWIEMQYDEVCVDVKVSFSFTKKRELRKHGLLQQVCFQGMWEQEIWCHPLAPCTEYARHARLEWKAACWHSTSPRFCSYIISYMQSNKTEEHALPYHHFSCRGLPHMWLWQGGLLLSLMNHTAFLRSAPLIFFSWVVKSVFPKGCTQRSPWRFFLRQRTHPNSRRHRTHIRAFLIKIIIHLIITQAEAFNPSMEEEAQQADPGHPLQRRYTHRSCEPADFFSDVFFCTQRAMYWETITGPRNEVKWTTSFFTTNSYPMQTKCLQDTIWHAGMCRCLQRLLLLRMRPLPIIRRAGSHWTAQTPWYQTTSLQRDSRRREREHGEKGNGNVSNESEKELKRTSLCWAYPEQRYVDYSIIFFGMVDLLMHRHMHVNYKSPFGWLARRECLYETYRPYA